MAKWGSTGWIMNQLGEVRALVEQGVIDGGLLQRSLFTGLGCDLMCTDYKVSL